jgi:Na+/H+-translocating membrane pyrophosphatase
MTNKHIKMHQIRQTIRLWTVILCSWVAKQDSGNEEMRGISDAIADGVMAFLKIAALQVFAKRLFIDHRYFNQLQPQKSKPQVVPLPF